MSRIIKRAFLNSFGTALYIILVVSLLVFLQNFQQIEDFAFIPIAMLLLLVCSAAITGSLVFGKPVMLYIDGKKREAVLLLGYTIAILVLLTILSFIILITYFV